MEENLYLTQDKKNVPEVNYRTSWNIYPQIIKKIKINGGERILDAGCGYGELSNWIKDSDLTGLDFRKDLVHEAKGKNYKKIVLGNIENLKFKNKEFDASFSIQVFQYLKNPEGAFGELLRVSKKQIILTIPNFNWLKLKSLFSPKWKKQYDYCIQNENISNAKFLRDLAKNNNEIKIKIFYLSNKFGLIRNIFGNILSSEIMGVYNLNERY